MPGCPQRLRGGGRGVPAQFRHQLLQQGQSLCLISLPAHEVGPGAPLSLCTVPPSVAKMTPVYQMQVIRDMTALHKGKKTFVSIPVPGTDLLKLLEFPKKWVDGGVFCYVK